VRAAHEQVLCRGMPKREITILAIPVIAVAVAVAVVATIVAAVVATIVAAVVATIVAAVVAVVMASGRGDMEGSWEMAMPGRAMTGRCV